MKNALIALTLLAGTSGALAQTVTYTGAQPMTTTNWGTFAVALPQFDNTPSGAFFGYNLTGVTLTVSGTVQGDVRLESLDNSAASLTYNLAASVTFAGPGGASAVALPVASGTFAATAFDGTIDFGGTSGVSLLNLTNSNTASSTPGSFAGYIGSGSVPLSIGAVGASNASGAGNVISAFATDASADYRIVYTYEAIPTPGAAALLGLGGLVAFRRRRA